jgi:formate-dependent nitrite reductase membrane component NrfD
LSALLLNMGFEQDAIVLNFFSPALSLIFLAATMSLLVFDLKRPGRFFYLLTKPNLRSWLVLGGYVLMIFGILASMWLAQGIIMGTISTWIVWSTALFAIASACYSAFLFAQARGRDFWQSPLLFWHLLIQAMTAGAAVLMLLGTLIGISPPMFYWLGNVLVITLCAGLAMIFAEHIMNRRSEEVARAGDLLIKGALWKQFWIFVVLFGVIGPIALILWPTASLIPNVIASVLVLLGLWMYENLWIKAGQAVPLS